MLEKKKKKKRNPLALAWTFQDILARSLRYQVDGVVYAVRPLTCGSLT